MEHADCLFCKIVKGAIPCAKVYETEAVLAFLDINPVTPGHTLVIPKAHHPTLFDLPEEVGCRLFAALPPLGRAILEATGATGLNVQMNNRESAGQVIFHAHLHLIPRRAGDGLHLWPSRPYPDDAAREAVARAVREALTAAS
ncbi:histidine triad (HIT) protein [Solidesulfovibrio carbinoliphilus subsp. oakridgensis]|uniref:Histidine triad (HIT) protein n=1 Tax=Solidesulfovibrio carbinoliphilus subsp. oakridgensis TaxID=694327 RepID=G7Q567_9BACT|nr:HIT family protein [Solidesulfovibrio carbinoliphilus]EHJ48390.1 histidine triad (HIT) protein [Solidesulfovibrio carbinoliphilus subsp. oakridgensis]